MNKSHGIQNMGHHYTCQGINQVINGFLTLKGVYKGQMIEEIFLWLLNTHFDKLLPIYVKLNKFSLVKNAVIR